MLSTVAAQLLLRANRSESSPSELDLGELWPDESLKTTALLVRPLHGKLLCNLQRYGTLVLFFTLPRLNCAKHGAAQAVIQL